MTVEPLFHIGDSTLSSAIGRKEVYLLCTNIAPSRASESDAEPYSMCF